MSPEAARELYGVVIAADGTAREEERVKITAVTATPIALPLVQPFH